MLATCLINSFNYRSYVGEAVASALNQTRPFDQILVVDDGSTDGSLHLLEQQFGQEPRLQIIGKENGGQLSCFNVAIPLVAGDLVFFLDADDRYRPTYLEKALAVYGRTGADFLVAGLENFGRNVRGRKPVLGERDLGYSVLTTMFAGTWVGGPTSSLSMRASLAKRILPFPFESEWRICADNVLVYGSSILGAHKYQLGELLVERRVHGANLFCGSDVDRFTDMRNALELNRLIAWYTEQAGYGAADLPRLLPREFRTIDRPTIKEFRRYVRLSWNSHQTLFTRTKQFFSLLAYMLQAQRTRVAAEGAAATACHPQRRAA